MKEKDYVLNVSRTASGWHAQLGYVGFDAAETKPYVVIMNNMILRDYKTITGAARALRALAYAFGAHDSSFMYTTQELLVNSSILISAADLRGATVKTKTVKIF